MRISLSVLAQRINQLSCFIRDQGLKAPSMDAEDFNTMKGVFETIGLEFEDTNWTQGPSARSETGLDNSYTVLDDSMASDDTTGDRDRDRANGLQTPQPTVNEPVSLGLSPAPPAVENHISSPNVASALLALADTSWRPPTEPPPPVASDDEEDDEDEVTNQLSCRLGKLQLTQGGQLRYFGSTSNFTLLDVLVGVAPSSPVSSSQQNTQEILDSADLGLEVDESLERHLPQLYFTWHDPSMHAVSEDVFWRSRAQEKYQGTDTPYYSRSLSDAM